MITELLGLAGSGAVGSVVGLLSDHLNRSAEIELAREQGRSKHLSGHVQNMSASPWFGASFATVVVCYCTCCIICLFWPNVPLTTFNPDQQPTSILWGFFEWSPGKTYTITTGGVGFGLLHPLAFAICSVLTGLSPMRRK